MQTAPKLSLLSASVISTLLLAGCSGSDSASTTSSTAPTPLTFTGTAADGYLKNAKVCLDKNRNGKCDGNTTDPETTTGNGGVYSLSDVTQVDMDTYPIIVEVNSNTIDEDNNQTVGGSYTLSARAGQYAFVSPLTTLVNITVAANPTTKPEEALAQIRSRLGVVDSGLLDNIDYVAAKNTGSDDNKALYANAHLVAQSIATVLKETNTTINGDKVKTMVVVDEITNNLSKIAEASDKQASATSLASQITNNADYVTQKATLKTDMSSATLPSTQEILTLMKEGLYWIENSSNWKAIGVSYATANSTTSSGTMVSKETSLNVNAWNTPSEGNEIVLNPNTNTWIKSDSLVKPTTFSIDNDGTFNMSSRYYETQTARGAVINLSGKTIQDKVNAYTGWTMSGNSANFRSGAQGIIFNRINKTEGWTIHFTEPNNGSCNNSQITAVNNNCNIVQVNGGNAITLSNLANNTVSVNGSSVARFNQAGDRATFYTNWNWQTNTGTQVADVPVNTITKGSSTFIALPLPASLRDKTEEDMVIFAVIDNVVRIGRHRAKDDITTSILFNKTAAEDVLTAAGLPAMPNWQ
jgi:hypothetical protein